MFSLSLTQRYQGLLDKSVPYAVPRWVGFVGLYIVYLLRIFFIQVRQISFMTPPSLGVFFDIFKIIYRYVFRSSDLPCVSFCLYCRHCEKTLYMKMNIYESVWSTQNSSKISLFLHSYLFAQGWFIITYALAIYHLNLFIAFLSPKIDPAVTDDPGMCLPLSRSSTVILLYKLLLN